MLKTLLGVLDSARSALSSDASLIRQALAPLGQLHPALGERAAAYVIDGSDPAVLLELARHAPQGGHLLANPGHIQMHYHVPASGHDQKVVEAGLAARSALYKRVGPGGADAAALARLGRVLEAADRGSALDRTGTAVPDWLQYLVNDALGASLTYEMQRDPDKLAELRPNWDVRLLRALLEHDGLPQALALNLVFERSGMPSYYHDNVYRRLLAPGALDQDMLANPDHVASAAQTLSATGRILLVSRIGANDAVRTRYAALMVKLAVGGARTVRAAAARYVDAIERSACHAELAALLRAGDVDERANAAALLARLQGGAAESTLDAALSDESSKPVQEAIRAALSRLRAAHDAAAVELPAPPPLPELVETRLADDAYEQLLANREEILTNLRQGVAAEEARNQTAKYKSDWQRRQYDTYTKLGAASLREALRALNGEHSAEVLADPSVVQTVSFGNRLEARPDWGLMQALRTELNGRRDSHWAWYGRHFRAWLLRQDPAQVDLRQLSDAAVRCGAPADMFALTCLRGSWYTGARPQQMLPPDRVWPCLAQHPALIDEGLGMAGAERGQYQDLDLGATLSALAAFPVIPARWLPRVMEIALGESKTHRPAAQRLMEKLPDIAKRVIEMLASTKSETRIEAARWLARMDCRDAVPALTAALDKETRETASATLMTALEHLGQDLSARLAPDVLLAAARKSLKAKAPAGLAWLDLNLLPACRWMDGSAVEPEIVRWWVVLAVRLKEPAANAMLVRHLGLLDAASRAALGRFVLHQFIARDTAGPALEEAIAHAAQRAPAEHQNYLRMAKQWPQHYGQYADWTEDQVFEMIKRAKLSEYLGSAIGEKGMLALIFGVPGHELADVIRLYMRDHYTRRFQLEAMLEGASLSDDPALIQFLLATARRYRTASVQQKARDLVERIAERNGWTQDELADRTVPTGGLDETGRMRFEYGGREFSVTLDDKLKPVLHNAEGKAIAALPAARQNDTPESIKEGKQLFTTCKKEVKQVIELQGARLYEAMCAGRVWPGADWDEYVRRHPLVGRLAQRLLWMRVDADGGVLALFRPTEDGSLIDADDDEVELEPGARIRLAHASLMRAADIDAWQAHFKDYKVTPLFAQLTRRAPVLADATATRIADRLGWLSDAFTLRNAFGKLGYQRGAAEDGGVFMEYTKDFASLGLRVRIEFSGNALPEENQPAALKTLDFVPLGSRSAFGAGGALALSKVPPVLLAEAWADYHAVAAACLGFDAEWERKVPYA